MEKFFQILRAYLFMILFKMGFINDVRYKRVLRQRIASCENCILRKGNWCSKRRVTAIINDEGKQQRVKGCSCLWKVKIFDPTPNTCPLGKFQEFQ